MLVSDFNYDLPEERIAKFPPKMRGTTRLLVLNRETGKIIDSWYRDLADFLQPGDLLILNDTRVMQSRLFCSLPDGRERELVVLEKHGVEKERVMYRGKLHEGDILTVQESKLSPHRTSENTLQHENLSQLDSENMSQHENISQLDSENMSQHENTSQYKNMSQHKITVKKILGNGIAEVESETALDKLTEKYGSVPLPPYLHRDATEADKKRYQTVWAKNMGSAAAPTASLNMTKTLLDKLKQKGVIVKYLTLHVGLGTFLPMRTENVEEHKMHSEWFEIPKDTLEEIEKIQTERKSLNSFKEVESITKQREDLSQHERRIIALGTTVARTLEYYGQTGKTHGEDDIFIYPGYQFTTIDALLTNFHAPKSTVLMLAAAFAGWDNLHNAYDHAVEQIYNFLSYGDSMLIC